MSLLPRISKWAPMAVPSVEDLVDRAVARLSEACLLDMIARYELGRDLYALRHQRSRGEAVALVEAVAKQLDVHTSALRRWSRVSGTIPPAEFGEYLSFRTRRGTPLTWSHLELVAEVTPACERRVLARECIDQELTVRSLAMRVRGIRKKKHGETVYHSTEQASVDVEG